MVLEMAGHFGWKKSKNWLKAFQRKKEIVDYGMKSFLAGSKEE